MKRSGGVVHREIGRSVFTGRSRSLLHREIGEFRKFVSQGVQGVFCSQGGQEIREDLQIIALGFTATRKLRDGAFTQLATVRLHPDNAANLSTRSDLSHDARDPFIDVNPPDFLISPNPNKR